MAQKHLLICFVFTLGVYSLYSPFYKRCRFNHTRVDSDAIPLQDLETQRVPRYYSDYYIQPAVKTELQLQYEDFDFLYHEYIDAGGSGEVYLVEQIGPNQGQVVKRFFQQKPSQFQKENYIMKKLNYSIRWAKDCTSDECQLNSEKFNTLSIFPYKESIVLRKIQFDGVEAALIFYKALQELEKSHKAGIIHNDLKMGNIMINSIGPNFKFYQVQLIDWNLASFYYTGLDVNGKRGTVCYYSPQQLLRSYHITPAIDVWALGIVMFIFYTDAKPFVLNCKASNIRAIVSLVGGQKILQMYKKYRYGVTQNLELLREIEQNPSYFPQRKLQDFQPKANQEFYTKELIQVFKRMFQPDPELRATPAELMQMDFFKKIKVLPQMYVEKNKRKKKQKSSQNKSKKKSQ